LLLYIGQRRRPLDPRPRNSLNRTRLYLFFT
jgi:hypothetical protein